MQSKMPSLTILICTHNRAALLQEVLDSLNAADRRSDWAIDILVVANACSDRTHELLAEYRRRQAKENWLPLRWIVEEQPGKSYALNSGLKCVESDLVFLEDDDQRVAPDFLACVCSAAETYPEATMFCGRLLPDWVGDEPRWIREDGPYRIYPGPVPEFDAGPKPMQLSLQDVVPSGGNLIMRLDAIRRVGDFSNDLGPKGHNLVGGEDMAYIKNALALGESLMYVPEILQYHYVDKSRLKLGYLLRLAYRRTHAVVRMGPRIRSFPPYVLRKLFTYLMAMVFTLDADRRRFFLIRTVAIAGEGLGLVERLMGIAPGMARRALRDRNLYRNLTGAVFLTATGYWLRGDTEGISAAGLVALVVAALLLAQSLLHFSRTGPQVREEIIRHYLPYSTVAMLRLFLYAFSICFVLGLIGLSIHQAGLAAFALLDYQPSFPQLIATCLLSTLALSGFQFCRHLLHIPASIEMSSNYRISRLYRLWARLSPALFDVVDIVFLVMLALSGIAGHNKSPGIPKTV